MKKYILTETTKDLLGTTLHQIKAVRSFGDVKEGELGGWIEKEENLSQEGNAWVSGDAWVSGNAWVYGNAWVSGDAWVSGNARVYGNAWVYGNARVSGDAWVYGNARVYGDARVYGNARVYGDARILSTEHIFVASSVGSEHGTLTAYTIKSGDIEITRGCFRGTIDEFESAVKNRHEDSRYAEEYLTLIQYLRLRFRGVVVEEAEESA